MPPDTVKPKASSVVGVNMITLIAFKPVSQVSPLAANVIVSALIRTRLPITTFCRWLVIVAAAIETSLFTHQRDVDVAVDVATRGCCTSTAQREVAWHGADSRAVDCCRRVQFGEDCLACREGVASISDGDKRALRQDVHVVTRCGGDTEDACHEVGVS